MTENNEVFEVEMDEDMAANASPGVVKIANDVVATIAGMAASEVPGVAGMSGGLVGGIAEKLGRKNLGKGIKVEVKESSATIEIYIIVEYGVKIQEVAKNIQESVTSAIENMTGLVTDAVNVFIQGVSFPQPQKEEAPAVAE